MKFTVSLLKLFLLYMPELGFIMTSIVDLLLIKWTCNARFPLITIDSGLHRGLHRGNRADFFNGSTVFYDKHEFGNRIVSYCNVTKRIIPHLIVLKNCD